MSKKRRPSISVTGKIYDRLRTSVTQTSLSKFVENVVLSALDDPTIRDRVLDKCRGENYMIEEMP
jgi:hypothetical protein